MGETERVPGELLDQIGPRVALCQYEDGREYVWPGDGFSFPGSTRFPVSFEWIVSREFGQNWQQEGFDFIDKARQVAGNVSVTGKRDIDRMWNLRG